ncbi:unnamed protein product [Dracunculus medinensis]|uniref:ShKT domain-containing protein n=1 Tax=Dracunculus medinensis TaxID=318479 RepID=A0A0N4UPI9_DRAME|nr:unnamed protein product [Dracunculus medinensis]
MFLFLLVLALVRRGESGDGVQLNKCLDPSTVPIARPLPSPSACKDKNPVICNAIFSVRSGAVVNNAVANGQCPDTGQANCGQLLLAGLNCNNEFMKQNCMATCRITTCLARTTAASACSDERVDCAQLASFCNTAPYSTVLTQQLL